jgi:aminoglycoside phosphotransferase (APT) family kinase protein
MSSQAGVVAPQTVAEVQAGIESRMSGLLPGLRDQAGRWAGPELGRITRLSAGASRLTWLVEMTCAGTARSVVVQAERPGAAPTVEHEAQLLTAAARVGVPVPELLAADPSGVVLGRPSIVTGQVAGETLPRRILGAPQLVGARARFAENCGRVLAAVHSIPRGEVPGLPVPDAIGGLREIIDESAEPHPVLEFALLWLEDNRPAPGEPVVLHGDFRNGNLVIDPTGIRAVLDWELAHVGDRLEDLGWLCVKYWRFGGPCPVGGMGEVTDLLQAYTEACGIAVDPQSLHWWQTLGTAKWAAICHRQARLHLSGEVRSVELAVIGRLAAEVELDLIRMLP